jgi:hypothetical protein
MEFEGNLPLVALSHEAMVGGNCWTTTWREEGGAVWRWVGLDESGEVVGLEERVDLDQKVAILEEQVAAFRGGGVGVGSRAVRWEISFLARFKEAEIGPIFPWWGASKWMWKRLTLGFLPRGLAPRDWVKKPAETNASKGGLKVEIGSKNR